MNISKKYDVYDVVVIGRDKDGMAAVSAAAESGLSAIMLCDLPAPVRMGAEMGVFSVESSFQKQIGYDYTKEQAFFYFMDHSHWKIDPDVAHAFVEEAGPAYEWLLTKGLKIEKVVAYYPGAPLMWHYPVEGSPDLVQLFQEDLEAKGAPILMNVKVTKLLQDPDTGKVIGVQAQTGEGEEFTISAGAVIVATDGAAPGLPDPNGHASLAPNVDLVVAAGAGGMLDHVGTICNLADPWGGPCGTRAELGVFRQPNLMVNQRGKRFITETTLKNPAYGSNAVLRQPGAFGYMIFDQEALEHYMRDGLDTEIVGENPVEGVDHIIDLIISGRGDEILFAQDSIAPPPMQEDNPPAIFKADSIRELAEQIEISPDVLEETVAEYNQYCDSGRDRAFYKDNRYLLPIRKGPFYCGKFHAFEHVGKQLNINGAGQVLTAEGEAIPGLYASGEFCFVIEGDAYPYAMAATCFMYGIAMSRIAVRDIAKKLKKL